MELPDNTCCTVLLSDIMLNTSSNPDACIEDPTDPKNSQYETRPIYRRHLDLKQTQHPQS